MSLNVSAYSIKNPLVAILLFVLLTLGGIYGFMKMKVQQFPDIDLPAVVVTVTLPGAAPSQLENDIAKKIENKLTSIEGVSHIRTTLQTGAATIATEFTLEKDIQEAVDDVRSAVGEVRGDLPAAANDPIITKVSTAGFPVVTYSVAAENMSVEDLSWFVDDTVTKRLSDIPGVSTVSRVGGLQREITVAADPITLSGLKFSISQLSQQIAGIQQDSSGGEAEVGKTTQTIRVLGAVERANELNDLQVAVPTGGTQALGRMAKITDGAADPSSIAKLDGQTVVAFNITRSRGASEVDVMELVDEELAKLTADVGNISIEKVYDRATPIAEDYEASLRMLIEGGLLAVVVVFLFLRNIRATIVAAVALPLSVIPTFLGMYLFGFSLNIISLLALSLVIGVLVDDAIVEVENIIRHLRMGKTPYEAAMEAADEIGLAVVATTFTLIAVFLPTAFMGGIVGQFFRQFGWTAALSIFASLMVARLITPMMAAYILRPEKKHVEKQSAMMKYYLKIVSWTLHHRWLTMGATLVLFVASLALVKLLPTSFIPDNDIDQTRVAIELTPDVSLADTERVAALASARILAMPEVTNIFTSVGEAQASMGASDGGGGKAENIAGLDIVLAPRAERGTKQEIERKISKLMTEVPGARFTVGLSSGGESGYNFSLTSTNPQLLEQTAQKIMSEIRGLPSAGAVTSDRSLPRQELTVTPDRLAMADKGVTTQDIATTLRVATVGDYEQQLSKLNLDTRQVPIVVRLPDVAKQNVSQLEGLYVPSTMPAGQGVRVGEVATLDFGTGPAQISRLDRERAISITVQPASGELGDLVQAVKAVPTMQQLPPSITIIDQGQAENMADLFSGFIIAMSVGVVCILGVLILLFGRLLQPFTILMALPLSIGGAFVGLVITNSSLSMPSMIGFIMLMGIATKNSILLVDYALIAQRRGLARFEAIVDACRKRARPIIMTTIAMGAGMLPLVFGWGDADPTFRRPMAAAVLGGLVTSTLLSLVVIPVVYTLMDDLSGWFAKWLAPHGKPSDS
ncbi:MULTISPECIES: efflux RND transporter permease subunit [Psychrobacter]|uniref:efflux RND transporter permease subunit n=1 Tax=Psychrobacter TaxID=497 RepID=UPI000C32E8B6|nr:MULTISPECIES: efflux RND transporter permease subunit [Psychrobacter]MBA6245468.1 efflux RND transporter permease subunit [Psychrobacter sp. Urea-trap-18]MBA6284773.1 efflux RND transporter permease subunit [Psychrobacter sp. Urea-trap-16]MBA6318608.1 efflux RND transporter permease subunit [Psychrobacter sp. Urea-trap-20]MBA6333078.1 efflux RND transporter permease subunit [Psychrobacter sp. Urea-trap-19]PKG59917.1 RND transporter [Psychrobacter sp. Choline-3u-12]